MTKISSASPVSRWRSLALSLLAGSFAANAIPHLVVGLTGGVFMTPFGPESSAGVNLAWGAANAVIGLTLAALPITRRHARWALIGAAAGVIGTAISLFWMVA